MKVGDKIETWFSDSFDGLSVVLEIVPYRGRYPQWFTHTVTVTAPRTRARSIQMAVDLRETEPPL